MIRILVGDSLVRLKELPDNSVDSVVCDPPYGLGKPPDIADVLHAWLSDQQYHAKGGGFMGKKWDAFVPGPAIWRECLRVLKPGGHLLAFFGTRTYDVGCIAIRLAGFEKRDMLAWLYGSGFPKSLDVGKSIDKLDAVDARHVRDLEFTAWMRSTGITSNQINDATSSNMGGHYLTNKEQPSVATLEMFEMMRHLLPEPPPEICEMMKQRTIESENFKRRDVVGEQTKARAVGSSSALPTLGAEVEYKSWDITAPATDEAKQWDGWGTALKPALEPVSLFRRPLSEGTVAANVLRWGTGGLNVDGTRVGTTVETWPSSRNYSSDSMSRPGSTLSTGAVPPGRWPANLVHDGSDEATSDMGEASRYFYTAKTSKHDRNEGIDGKSDHPTVKPTNLMRWLCRLVTQPGGVVLDPFMGSGSTGKAAVLEGFSFIGCELDPKYAAIAEARIHEISIEKIDSEVDKEMSSQTKSKQVGLFG